MESKQGKASGMNRRRFLRWLKRAVLASPVAAGGGYSYARFWERHNLEVKFLGLDLGLKEVLGLSETGKGTNQAQQASQSLRVGLLSDFHFDPLFEVEYLEKVIETTNAQNLDVLCLTGDFVSSSLERVEELAAILGKAQARLGSFAVMGNHDFWAGEEGLTRALEAEGIRVLRNESEELAGLNGIYVSGLDSYWAGEPSLSALESTPADSKHLLLVHEPDSFDELDDERILLQLSGHTHGGQVRAPFWGALWLPSWGRKYVMGLFQRGSRYLYVNRGVGVVKKRLRFLCRPELTVFELS